MKKRLIVWYATVFATLTFMISYGIVNGVWA